MGALPLDEILASHGGTVRREAARTDRQRWRRAAARGSGLMEVETVPRSGQFRVSRCRARVGGAGALLKVGEATVSEDSSNDRRIVEGGDQA